MRHNGHFQPLCRPYGGETDVPALGKDEIKFLAPQDFERLPLRRGEAEGHGQIFWRQRTHKLGAVDAVVWTAEGAHKPAFHAVRAHICNVVGVFEFLHNGEVGDDVSRAPAACKEQAFHVISICFRAFFRQCRAGAANDKNFYIRFCGIWKKRLTKRACLSILNERVCEAETHLHGAKTSYADMAQQVEHVLGKE